MAETYDITNIVSRQRSIGGGTFKRVHEVTFTTKPSGLVGVVDVDDADFAPETVAAAVTAAAARLEAVKNL